MGRDSSVLFIGAVDGRGIDLSTVRYIETKAQANKLELGEIVRRFDFVSIVDDAALREEDLEPLRRRGDVLADGVVEALQLKPGQDALAAIEANLASEEPHEAVRAFWKQMNAEPPAGVSAARDGAYDPDLAMQANDRHARPSLAAGQAVFWRYSTLIFDALGHFSLAGGFSAPKLAAVLNETGYLTSASKDATYRRLLETTLFVLDVAVSRPFLTDAMAHTVLAGDVRHDHWQESRIRNGKGLRKTYDEGAYGIPINQADMITVLGSFMIAPLWSLRRSGISLTRAESEAYQAAWRHVGYYLGIDADLLERFYGRSFAVAESSFATAAFDIFPVDVPLNGYDTPTYRILSAISDRPPRGSSVGVRCEVSRALLGPRLADQLAIPRGSFRDRLTVKAEKWAAWYFVEFGRHWRNGWDVERQSLFRHIMHLLVIWQLGERRTVYAWRKAENHADKLDEKESEEPGIVMGRPEGLKVKRRWKLLLGEMVGVTLLAAGATCWMTVQASRFAIRALQ